ncbi:MAG: rhodanese-like domain-containing protein [Halobacteriota archaeon]|nr:rhodanese-like domain-containing protein [Halobacteriota archaeon]
MALNRWKILALVSLLITSLLISGCILDSQIYGDITPKEANELIDERSGDEDFVILDVRTSEEFSGGHIEGAIIIDFNSENFEDEIGKLDRNITYLIYCRTARRSSLALDIMEDLGFTDVYNLKGGIVRWEEEGFPVVR